MREQQRQIKATKQRVTRALRAAGFDRATETTDGFRYSDEGEYGFVSREEGASYEDGYVLVLYSATELWGGGHYAEANKVAEQEILKIGNALNALGEKFHVAKATRREVVVR